MLKRSASHQKWRRAHCLDSEQKGGSCVGSGQNLVSPGTLPEAGWLEAPATPLGCPHVMCARDEGYQPSQVGQQRAAQCVQTQEKEQVILELFFL